VHGLYHLDGLAARLARRRPYVVHLQGMPVRRSLIGRPVQRRLFRASVSGAAALITVSRAAADALRVEFGLPARPLLNGVDTAMFASGSAGVARTDTPSVLFPGDPADVRKRLDLLVQAVAALRQAGDDVTLLIAAPVRNPDIRRRVVEQLDGAVEFLDIATPDAMPAAYGRAWITCAPAVREAFGLVIVESLATGTPVVAVRDGGVTEVLREPSWLAEPDDAVSLATAIRQALTAAGDAGSPAHCRALAAPFDWSVRGPAFEELYADVVTTP
jgi:glycosyltransferase involved in cell wall biosynthesis